MAISPFRGLRAFDRVLFGALLFGGAGLLAWLASLLAHINIDSGDSGPYPTFGQDRHWRYIAVVFVYAMLWLKLTISELKRSSSETSTASLVLCLFIGILMAAACISVCLGIDCLNAWLDFSAPQQIQVLVQDQRTAKRHTKYGVPYHVNIARVTRLDRQGPAFDVPWDSCQVPSPAIASTLATVNVGRGAFGIPWISLPIVCRPLALADRPLAANVFLGRGAPVVLVTLDADDASEAIDRSPARATVPKWIDAVEHARPGVSTVLLYDGAIPEWASSVCSHSCRSVSQYEADRDVLALFLHREGSEHGDHLYVADAKGQQVFSAALSNFEGMPECTKRLAEMAK